MNFNMEYYRTFYYVANYLNMTRAAEIMSLSQPAVSHSIKLLEEHMGCRLFHRLPRGLQLTKEGEILFAHVNAALRELEKGEQSVARYSGYETGSLVIGAVELATYFFLPDILLEFKKQFPLIDISVIGRTNKEILKFLEEGTIDIAIVIEPLLDNHDFTAIPIMTLQDAFLYNKDNFPELYGKKHKVKDILQYPIITLGKETSSYQFYESWLASQALHLQPQYSIRSSASMLPFIEKGLGIGLLPQEYQKSFASHNGSKKIHVVETDIKFPGRTLYLLTNKRFPRSSICRMLIKFIKQD